MGNPIQLDLSSDPGTLSYTTLSQKYYNKSGGHRDTVLRFSFKENLKRINDFRKRNKIKSAQNWKKVLCIRDEDLDS